MTILGMVDLWKELRDMEHSLPFPEKLHLRNTRMAVLRILKEKAERNYIPRRGRLRVRK